MSDKTKIFVCKKTKKTFSDFENKSGAITIHLKRLYPNNELVNLSKFKRKKIEKQTGKPWYIDYFDIKIINKEKTKKCDYCNWKTTDTNNRSGAYKKHLLEVHNKTVKDHIKNYPGDVDYFSYKPPLTNGIKCKICGKTFRILNHKHLKTHNISLYDYKQLYGDNIVSDDTKQTLHNNWENFLKYQPFKKTSSYEDKLIKDFSDYKIEISNRSILNGQEIDILFTNHNIGLEINGLFYHSEFGGKKDKNYHLNKTLLANQKGYELIHIFEDEIREKYDIVIKRLKHIIGGSETHFQKIHGRKCIIKEVKDVGLKNKFLLENHLQGHNNSPINIGAFFLDELVAIMCFDNKRYFSKTKNHTDKDYELTRFTINNNYIVNGIGSRLLKYFEIKYKPETIISFADRRWINNPNNNIYSKLGFEYDGTIKPDYYYVHNVKHKHKRIHKFSYGKKQIQKQYPEVYHKDKTEKQMMLELGYDRIWDCGKFRYIKKFTNIN